MPETGPILSPKREAGRGAELRDRRRAQRKDECVTDSHQAANGAITLLEQPGRTLNEIIQANWQPATENEDVVEKVLEWLE